MLFFYNGGNKKNDECGYSYENHKKEVHSNIESIFCSYMETNNERYFSFQTLSFLITFKDKYFTQVL